ncbi:alpha/beta hydrolase fold-3 domain-containing protein [Rhexocercosporidium sp. MPI-PUGE-AT-0058]|nr:alpha/beta hydrolase fold-3 domain-containing protein [Rhexocercosporidium sp. MPI-PUGE-AT-0058]
MSFTKAPPFDPELDAALAGFPKESRPLDHAGVLQRRQGIAPMCDPARIFTDPEIGREEITIPGPGGEIAMTILRPKKAADSPCPVFYYIHGGALVLGDRYFFLGNTFPLVKEFNAVVVSVEYRLAPESPAPAQVEDSYAGLKWVFENASKLGIDPAKIIVSGSSAGGCLAVGAGLMARDKKGPPIFALLLSFPMLDDRCNSVSIKQYMDDGAYTGSQNIAAWDMVLPGTRGSKDVSIYVAPSRAEDLSGLPPTYISVGAGDPFRDEDVAFASKLWEYGVSAELHVWQGAWHGFTGFVPTAEISVLAVKAEMDWLRRILK